jgi:GntR family transcriptional regulator, arabinose operon transcriptional repressor
MLTSDAKPLPKEPLYQRIYSDLKLRIAAGEWRNGSILPTENELGETYQVSRGTVRQVLAEMEREGLVRRERGRGTFLILNGLERPIQAASHSTISFIVPYVRDSFVSSILLGVENAARASGCAVVFKHVENDLGEQEIALRTAFQEGSAGIILYPVNSKDASPVLNELMQRDYPLVLVDRYIRGLYSDYVTSDNFGGGLIATQHLLSLGHRKVVFLSWTEMATTMEHRRAGYRQAMQEADAAWEAELEWEVKGYPEVDLAALEERLTASERPTAIFAANDQLALAVQRVARSIKLSIPEDLALVGFDNLEISAHVDIPITTVAQPTFEMGRLAGVILLNKVKTAAPEGVMWSRQRRVLPVQMIVRQSCGAEQIAVTIHPSKKGG